MNLKKIYFSHCQQEIEGIKSHDGNMSLSSIYLLSKPQNYLHAFFLNELMCGK